MADFERNIRWHTNDPITEHRMNNIQIGIEEALDAANTANQSSTINTLNRDVSTLKGIVGETANEGLQRDVTDLRTLVNQASGDDSPGAKAYTQVLGATTENTPKYNNLDERFTAIEQNFNSDQSGTMANTVGLVGQEVAAARVRNNSNGTNTSFTSLVGRLNNTDQTLQNLQAAYNSFIDTDYTNAKGTYPTLGARLAADETTLTAVYTEIDNARKVNGTLDDRLDDIEGDINAAKASTTMNHTYTSMDERFETIETEIVNARGNQTDLDTRLDTLESNIGGVTTDKVNKTDIENNLTTPDTTDKHVLDARQGRILKETIDALDAAYKLADGNLNTRLAAIDGGSAIDATNGTLATRVEALETTVDTATTGLSDRMVAAESAINDAGGLTERLTAVETSITGNGGIEERLDAIDNANTGAIKALQDADEDLEDRLDAIDGGTVLDITNGTLAARVTAAETLLNSTTTTANSALQPADIATLTSDVNTLKGKDTFVVDYNGVDSNYTNDVPNLDDPSEDADYLIADDNGKYFYWRYFGAITGWQLVGGAGGEGGGTGNSSGLFIPSFDVFEGENALTPDLNTDYFVGNNETGYTHYRFIEETIEDDQTHEEITTLVPHKILPNNLINSIGVRTINVVTEEGIDGAPDTTTVMSGGLNAFSIDDEEHNTNLLSDFVALRHVRVKPIYSGSGDDQVLESQQLIFTDTNGQTSTLSIQGGGGGAAAIDYNLRFLPTTASTVLNIPINATNVIISAKPLFYYGNQLAEQGNYSLSLEYRVNNGTWIENNTLVEGMSIINNTPFTIDITQLVKNITGSVQIKLTLYAQSAEEGSVPTSKSLTFTINIVELSIEANEFHEELIRTGNFYFRYICHGANLAKTVNFILDENTENEIILQDNLAATNNEAQSAQYLINTSELTTGTHKLTVYFTANGIKSNTLNYYILYQKATDAPAEYMIGIAPYGNAKVTYGDNEHMAVAYTVYNKHEETTPYVQFKVYSAGQENSPFQTSISKDVDNTTLGKYVIINPPASGDIYIKASIIDITYTDQEETEIDTITELVSDITKITIIPYSNSQYSFTSPVTSGNILYNYTAYGKANTDLNRNKYIYTYTNDVSGESYNFNTDFKNFNWSSNGYKNDGSILVNGGASIEVNAPILISDNQYTEDANQATQISLKKYGRTISIDYQVLTAIDLAQPIITYYDANDVGFKITPSTCFLTGTNVSANIDADGQFIDNEASIAAAYLNPGERINLTFVIEPEARTISIDKTYHQRINIYINGSYANSCPYDKNASFDVTNGTKLVIGDASCSLKIFNIHVYNKGLTASEVLQDYKLSPLTLEGRLARFEENDILNAQGKISYEKARLKYNCLLLTGPDSDKVTETIAIDENTNYTYQLDRIPTMSPYKGYKSPVSRKNKRGDIEGKVESGLTLTKPNIDMPDKYQVEFELLDKVPVEYTGTGASLGTDSAYCSSNNVQGTSSQKYPVHNLKIYLAKWNDETHKIEKVKYPIHGYQSYSVNDQGEWTYGKAIGTKESTLCWKADYMSTDHANTYNANWANKLLPAFETNDDGGAAWISGQYQHTVNGFRCLLFQKQGDNEPIFIGDGCLNNDKGNSETYGLEDSVDISDTNYTKKQKWEFTNNSELLGFFKSDKVYTRTASRDVGTSGDNKTDNWFAAKNAFESTYPDQGDMDLVGFLPNYGHLQLLLTWVYQRARYMDIQVGTRKVTINGEEVEEPIMETVSDTPGTGGTYDGVDYSTERELKRAIFKAEFEKHFNLQHVLTYYLFSEFIALCDNRVKNMFIRNEDVLSEELYLTDNQKIELDDEYTYDAELDKQVLTTIHANKDILEATVNVDGTDVPLINNITGEVRADLIDWENSKFTQWIPVLYDLDSCFGLENVGSLTIRYDADWDYKWHNNNQFSGYDSVFWRMVADTFATEIEVRAKALYDAPNGLSYSSIYNDQIVDNENSVCAELINQDTQLKFIDPWNNGFVDYSQTEPTPSTEAYVYLSRGTRKAQKASFMKKRSTLLGSKYQSNAYQKDTITFRSGRTVSTENTYVTITPNQLLYPMVQFGDNKSFSVWSSGLAQPNQTCEVHSSEAMTAAGATDGIAIAGASSIVSIGDISKFAPYQIVVNNGVNLKQLILGSDTIINSYTPQSITGIGNCTLLEELNIRNMTSLETLDLSGNGLLKILKARGSGIKNITLPEGGVLTTLELGAATTAIKILNQPLTNFTFEGSDGLNPYANVKQLWIENTPNVPIVDIINTRLNDLINGVRLINIDIDLGDDPKFLQKINSTLAQGKYITNTGIMPANNTDYPQITGTVRIHTIRKSLYNELKSKYPELKVVYDQPNGLIDEFSIEYVDWDGTHLYTLNGTAMENYIDPAVAINPITGNPYITWPTRDSTAKYNYYFGSYTENMPYTKENYIEFSGWIKEYTNNAKAPLTSGQIEGNNIARIRATYDDTTELRSYTVSWYKTEYDREPIVPPITRHYGTDISSTVVWPDANGQLNKCEQVNNSYYRVFTGWDHPGGELTSDLRINALWETSNISAATSIEDFDLNNLTAADLYALGQVSPATRTQLLAPNLSVRNAITLQMGHDFNFRDIMTYNLLGNNNEINFDGGGNKIIFDGNGTQAIYPFRKVLNPETNEYEYQDFTLALDYQITMNTAASSDEYILASCYSTANATKSGFKLALRPDLVYNNMEPLVFTWGADDLMSEDTYQVVDYRKIVNDGIQYSKNYRNMIVISYSKNEPQKIKIYYSGFYSNNSTASPDQYDTKGKERILEYDIDPNENMSLVLGQSANYKLYWGKYWQANIGLNNCIKLANWPHEKIHCYLTGYEGDNSELTNPKILDGVKLTFVTAEIVGDRLYNASYNYSNNTTFGWHTSPQKTFYNERIYQGLSTAYQSVITATALKTSTSNRNSMGSIVYETTYDNLLFLPAEREINPNSDLPDALRSWSWLTTDLTDNSNNYLLNVYKFRGTSSALERQASLDSIELYRCRFKDYYISKDTNIFIAARTPYNNRVVWSIYNSEETVSLSDGDIWIKLNSSNQVENVYVYVNNDKVNEGAVIDLAVTRNNGMADGGWRLGDFWQLRTYDTQNQGSNPQWRFFDQINRKGQINYGQQTSSTDYGMYKGITFEFAI